MAKDNLVWEDAPTSDNFSWQIPPSVQKQRDNLAKKMIEDELAFDPSDPNQGALEQEYKQRFKATPPELEWEDAPLVWEDAPQPQEPMTKSEAFGRGFLNEALALSRFFGGDVDKTLKKSTDRKLEAAKEHPLTTGLGGLTTDVIAALPGIVSAVETPLFVSPLVSGLGGGWLAQGAVSGALSGSAIGGAQGTARYQEVLNQTGDEDAATKAAMSAGLTAQLGTALPPAFGGGLASRVGQGAAQNIGLNEIDVAIQNQLLSEYPESQLEQFSPANMALAGITGGIFGGLSSRKLDSSNISQKKIKEPKDLVDPNRNIGEELNKIFTDDLKSKEQDLNLKIDELYRDSVDGQLHPETQELLQQYLFELDNVKTKLARIEGKEVTAKGVMDEEAAFQKQMQDELEQQVREDPLLDVDPSGVTNPYFGVKRPDLINPLEDVKQGWNNMDIESSSKKSPFFEKDKKKFADVNKLIARGSKNSSSNAYSKIDPENTNTGSYTKDDIVGISAEGSRPNRIPPDFVEIKKAINAGATIITDDVNNRNRSFNVGEREVAQFLESNGYKEQGTSGVWTPKSVEPQAPPKLIPMYYKMAPNAVRRDLRGDYPEGTSTLEMIMDGNRTATTRSQPLGKVGDLIRFDNSGRVFRITKVEQLKQGFDWGEWANKEGWDPEFIQRNPQLRKQVSSGAWQTSFVEVNKPKQEQIKLEAKDKDTLDRLYMWQEKLTKQLEDELSKENTPVFNKQKIEELQEKLQDVTDTIEDLEDNINAATRGLKEPQFNKVGSLKEAIDTYPKVFKELLDQYRASNLSSVMFLSEYIRIASRYLDPGIHYINGSLRPKTMEFIKTLDNIFGISKNHRLIVTGFQEFPEDIRTKLESDPTTTLGRNYETYQGTTLIYMSPGKWNNYLNRFPIVRKQIENLPPNIREDFSEMFVLAHEFGHNFLNRLKESKLLTDNALDKLFKAFESDKNLGMEKFQELTRITPFSDMAPERFSKSYGNFHEWWANNFAKYALYSGNEYVGIKQFKGAPDWLRKELGKLSNMFGSLVSYFKRFFPKWNLSSNEVFKSFIQDYIQKNQESIQATGKHLLERHLVNYAKTGVLNNDVINFMDKFGRTNPNEYSGGVNNLDIDTPEIVDRKLQQNEPKDIGFISLKGLANYFGDSQFRTIFSDNPIITNMENIIKNAEYNAAKMFNDLWYGITDFEGWNRVKKGPIMALKKIVAENSPAKLMETIPDKDLITVWNVIKQGFGKPYEDTLKTFGATLTPKQKEAFDILTKMFRQQYSSVVNHMDKLGKKSVLPFKDGWYPAVRKGDFYIELRNDVGDIIYREHFRTPEQANIFTRRFFNVTNSNRKGILISPVQKVAKEAHNTFAVDLSRIIAEEFQKTDPKAIEKVDILLDKMMVRGGKLGRHHQHRSNISGYMGSELFMSDRHMAESIRNAVKSSAEEYSGILRLMEIKTNSFKMIDTPSELVTLNYPNSLESAKLMRDMATNNVGSNIEGVDNFVRTVFDRAVAKVGKRLGKDFYPKVPVYDRVSGALGHIFYMFTLTSRPAVWIGQGLTSIFSLRHMLREENVFQAMRHAGDGILRMTNPDKDFANAVYWAADRGIFSPQFNNDLTRLPMTDGAGHNVLKTVVEYLSGEKFSAAGDTFSRYWTFATMYSMYKAKGLHGEKLLSTAADATDTTMVQYNRGHKAPMFQKAGIIGDQLSPLQTFAQANLANFVADARLLIKDPSFKNSAPLIATFLTTMLFAGAVGTPFLAEYEVLRRLLLWIDPDLDDILPDPIGSMMQGNDRTFSHGIISEATGYDIGSTMRWNPVISDVFQGREDFINMFPIIAATTKIGGAFATEISAAAGSDITDAQLREAMLNATPGGYKGLVDDLVFNADDRNFVPGGKRGFAKTEQTSEERIAKYLGTSTTETRRNDTVLYRQKQKEMKRNEQKTKYLDILSDGVEKGDSARINRAVTKLQELEVPWSEIWNNIQSIQGRRNIPELERQYTSPKGTTKSYNQMRRYEELQKALGE